MSVFADFDKLDRLLNSDIWPNAFLVRIKPELEPFFKSFIVPKLHKNCHLVIDPNIELIEVNYYNPSDQETK